MASSSRIVEVSVEELDKLRQNATPANTRKNTSFAVNLYNMWSKEGGHPPLDCGLTYLVACAVPKFCAEIRKPDGTKYKASTIQNIFSGLSRYYVNEIDPAMSFFQAPEFKKCYATVDGLIREMQKTEDPKINKAKNISNVEENKLWENNILGDDEPMKLVKTLLFMCGKYFGIRGGDELRNPTVLF